MTSEASTQNLLPRRVVQALFVVLAAMAALLFLSGSAWAEESQNATGASNGSGGDASAASGDATAGGNASATDVSQPASLSVKGHNGSVQIIDQDASVSNNGSASANTGGNTAVGNSSENEASSGQVAVGDGSVAGNTGSTSNSSDGTAAVSSGDANATGNQSNTTVNQHAQCDASGGLGGICIVNQNADVDNNGTARANTGGNSANGNNSENEANTDQDDDGSSNGADTSNDSDGTGVVSTGNAGATGNDSTTGVHQSVGGTVGGSLGGILIVNQSAAVDNNGTANANTGRNTVVGNQSENEANTVQGAVSGAGPPTVASNDGETTNTSDGTAGIVTGDATATGNRSDTDITQTVDVANSGKLGGVAIVNQEAEVENSGFARANTGRNTAVGNASENEAQTEQEAEAEADGDGNTVAANFGSSTNESDGTGIIATGDATAVGNDSNTSITQAAHVPNFGLVFIDQDAEVENSGTARANTGRNTAIGNASENEAETEQEAEAEAEGDGSTVAANFGQATNWSDGTAVIASGDANAAGSVSTTGISQVASADDVDGISLIEQEAEVTNEGFARAHTGRNTAVGNTSENEAETEQEVEVEGDDDEAETSVASNFGDSSNTSDGTAVIATGDATAAGNVSYDAIVQVAAVDPTLAIVDQDVDVENEGEALATSGFNEAVGNDSENDAATEQEAESGSGEENVVAANFGSASNTSDGTAIIATGDAIAVGNASATGIAQVATVDVPGSGFAIVDQNAEVENEGEAEANSGFNTAVGNASENEAEVEQEAAAEGDEGMSIASNDGQAINESDGMADILTGCAIATGNSSETNIGQLAHPMLDGPGFAIVDQNVDVDNSGEAAANSGFNEAVGNASENDAETEQEAEVESEDDAERLIANNSAETVNASDGTAVIVTGDACATGNQSLTDVGQLASFDPGDIGFAIVDQAVEVDNEGEAVANSGFNTAVGNESENEAETEQVAEAESEDEVGDLVANNAAGTLNASDGSAVIATGDAVAIGNESITEAAQASIVDGGEIGFAIVDQEVDVENAGEAAANSGFNEAVGNASENNAETEQEAEAASEDEAEALIANNAAATANVSDGTAVIATGDAGAIGNHSITHVAQLSDVDPSDLAFAIVDQDAEVDNFGAAAANSGFNEAVGNESENEAETEQVAEAESEDDAEGLIADNAAGTLNVSDGTAAIVTGSATAFGNVSATDVVQIDPVIGFAIVDQEAEVDNFGEAEANSGFNEAVGNESENEAETEQVAEAESEDDAEDVIANNAGATANVSDGTAVIDSGDALAVGNYSATLALQVSEEAASGFTLVDQEIEVDNEGEAEANSGFNEAVGNDSENEAESFQLALAIGGDEGDLIANNQSATGNVSDGNALIATGNATAFGNVSATSACQFANTDGFCPEAVLPPLPELPKCECHKDIPPAPPVPPVPPVTPEKPEIEVLSVPTPPIEVAEVAAAPGRAVLAFTGTGVLGQLLLGLLLLALGALLLRVAPKRV